VFVTSQVELSVRRPQRAVERGQVLLAVASAHELGRLSLSDSLALLLLFAEKDPERFERAAPRWHARLVLEAKSLDLAESQLALAAVALLSTELRQTGRRSWPGSPVGMGSD
jgi:hypothetical protein